MIELWNKIRESLQRALGQSIQVRILLSVTVAILVGSGALGVISEFATYSYAIAYGFRPPVEGIPYLQATVMLLSIIILVGGMAGVAIVYSLAKMMVIPFEAPKYVFSKIRRLPTEMSVVDVLERMRERPTKHVVGMSAFSSTLAGGLFTVAFWVGGEINAWWQSVALFLGVTGGAFFMYIMAFRPRYVKYFAGGGALVIGVAVLVLMFHAETYGTFLRLSGFGGGKQVTVYHHDVARDDPAERIEGGLLLRTSTFVILYKPREKEIVEVPMSRLRKIEYGLGAQAILPPLNELSWLSS